MDSSAPVVQTQVATAGAIDCDVHPRVPSTTVLLPYLDRHWRELIETRGMQTSELNLTAYPPHAPLTSRPDWRGGKGGPSAQLSALQEQALDGFGLRFAICNCLYGASALRSEDLAAALCRAANDWLAREWLDRDPRLRASILVPVDSPELAVEEIERRAEDRRFVQVLMLASAEMPLGRRALWPVYRAAIRHGLPIGVHAGGTARHAPTSVGWPSYFLEDYVNQAQAFESQVLSLVAEGAFAKFPELRIVCIESGFMWLPALMWRANKTWRGVRAEIPWVRHAPADLIRQHVRFTLQPFDTPPSRAHLETILDQIGSEELLLFSTDYPHWQFEGNEAMPDWLPPDLRQRIMVDNPLATYPRLAMEVPG